MRNVIFFIGTKAQYDALESHNQDALYWLSDVQEIRKGDDLYAKGQEATNISSGLMSSADKEKLTYVRTGHTIPSRITDYLYDITYDDYDYSYGFSYMEKYRMNAMCSALRKGNLIGRNLDWLYNEHPNFVIHTAAVCGRHATLGVGLAVGNLTNEVAKSGAEADEYKVLPFFVSDAINDCGVYISVNVVTPGDRGYTIGTGGGSQKICQLMLPRYIADYASSAKEAIDMIRNMDVYAPLNEVNEEAHFLICDEDNSYIVEFINNEMVVYSNTDAECLPLPLNECILTNFYINGWSGELKAVYAGYSAEDVAETGLNEHAMGIERHQILRDLYGGIQSVEDVSLAMQAVRYLKSYEETTNPFWYSEFTGDYTAEQLGDLTIYSQAEDFAEILKIVEERYRRFQRDSSIWITSHTAIYDISTRKLCVYLEEDYEHKYEFQLTEPGIIPGAEWSDF